MHVRALVVGLLLVATAVTGSPAVAATPVTAVAAPAVAPAADPAGPAPTADARRFPSFETIRSCVESIRALGLCAATGIIDTCLTTYSALLRCATKVYSTYRTVQKILDFRHDPRCPASLGFLEDYLCAPRVPQAPPQVYLTVSTPGRVLNVFTGPATWFTTIGSYADRSVVGVVCVATNGQLVTDSQTLRSSTYWARLSNGSFISWLYLTGVGRVPYC